MGVFVLLPLVEQQSLNRIKLAEEFEHKRTCRIHLPVLFISHHNFPVSDIVFTDYRVLVQLEYDHIVKAGNVDLNLPEVVKIIALPLAREWHVPLSELPVQVVERHKVTLIHQSEVGPQLDHLCCAVNKHLSLHVGLASTRQHPRDCRQCTPNIRLWLLLRGGLRWSLPVLVDYVLINAVHQRFWLEKSLQGAQRRCRDWDFAEDNHQLL